MTREILTALRRGGPWLWAALLGGPLAAQQVPDTAFNTTVARPAYSRTHPTVVIDEAHGNFHTALGRYRPLASLLTSDGYRVVRGTGRFTREGLSGVGVLVISNATALDATDDVSGPAFAEQECDVVRDWVRSGGALLFIADHRPYGAAAANLARRFGVDMGNGMVFDTANGNGEKENPTVTLFTRENGLLGNHAVLRGRDPSEEVKRLAAFTGQSLSVPNGAVVLLKLSSTALEAVSPADFEATRGRPVRGRAQGIAMELGEGRVVVMAEAAMFSAQVVTYKDGEKEMAFNMGMNVPGNDDRQFALNVLHWLSRLLP